MDLEYIRTMFEETAPNAPFEIDLTIDHNGKYVSELTQRVFQSFAEGYFDGYCQDK